jgi:predicted DNA-binding transcriptional regulator AlpA
MNKTQTKRSVLPAAPPITDSGSTLLTREEVAQQLNLGTISIARRTWSGELKCIRLSPSCVRYRQQDIDEYLAAKRS